MKKQQNKPIETILSKCCKASLLVLSEDEGTSYYECTICKKPADIYVEEECYCDLGSPNKEVCPTHSHPDHSENKLDMLPWENRFHWSVQEWRESKDLIDRTVWFIS